MPVLPLFFDTIPELGATKLRSTFPYPFLHLRERFETLAVVVIFSTFWAGKFGGHAKIARVVVHHCHGASPTIRNKDTNGRGPNRKNGRETIFRTGDGTLGGKNEISARTGRDWYDRHGDRAPADMSCTRSPSGKNGRASLVRTTLWLHAAFTGAEP